MKRRFFLLMTAITICTTGLIPQLTSSAVAGQCDDCRKEIPINPPPPPPPPEPPSGGSGGGGGLQETMN
jgi:hypothetical protein